MYAKPYYFAFCNGCMQFDFRCYRDFDAFDLRMRLPAVLSKLHKVIKQNGGVTYIHCTAGLGRAPAVAVGTSVSDVQHLYSQNEKVIWHISCVLIRSSHLTIRAQMFELIIVSSGALYILSCWKILWHNILRICYILHFYSIQLLSQAMNLVGHQVYTCWFFI